MVEKMLHVLFLELAGLNVEAAPDEFAELFPAERPARESDHCETLRQKPFAVEGQKRRQKLARSQVTGDAEDDEYGRMERRGLSRVFCHGGIIRPGCESA